MPKLNQIIAIEKGIKNESNVAITAAYHDVQKAGAFAGISRRYEPKDEDGEKFPPETQKLQRRAEELLAITQESMTKYWDITLTKDAANTRAKADVVVGGMIILKDAPVTFLLFLEKQLTDLSTILKKIPTLDPSEEWKYDPAVDCYSTPPSPSIRMKKIHKPFVRAQATKEHPAQVDLLAEDMPVGTWHTVKYSGALPQKRVTTILERVDALKTAVKFAREEANSISVEQVHLGKQVFAHLFE